MKSMVTPDRLADWLGCVHPFRGRASAAAPARISASMPNISAVLQVVCVQSSAPAVVTAGYRVRMYTIGRAERAKEAQLAPLSSWSRSKHEPPARVADRGVGHGPNGSGPRVLVVDHDWSE